MGISDVKKNCFEENIYCIQILILYLFFIKYDLFIVFNFSTCFFSQVKLDEGAVVGKHIWWKANTPRVKIYNGMFDVHEVLSFFGVNCIK